MVDVSVEAGALARGGDVHGEVRLRPGGAGANAAVWAAAEGARVRLYGRVGGDMAGHLVCRALEERAIEAVVVIDRSGRTGAMLVVREAGDRSMVADRGPRRQTRSLAAFSTRCRAASSRVRAMPGV